MFGSLCFGADDTTKSTGKTLADAIFEAELHTKQEPKHAALSGLTGQDLVLLVQALNSKRVFGIRK